MNTDFITAAERSMHIRRLYQQLEERNHNGAWTTEEDMLAFTTDIGALGRLVMSAKADGYITGRLNRNSQPSWQSASGGYLSCPAV